MSRFVVYEVQKRSSSNNQVIAIQESLPIWALSGFLKVDGIFGVETESAVKRFQKESGLSADGVVGPETGTALGVWSSVEKGFDASHWNRVSWQDITADYSFCNLKATQGTSYVDPAFHESVKKALGVGLSVGAYHFTQFENSPFLEAANFLDNVSEYAISRLYLDLEYRQSSLSALAIYTWVENFLSTISGVLPGARIGIYTSRNYMSEIGLQQFTGFSKFDLWAASWGSQPYVYPWSTWDVWQYTSKGDVDWAEGDIDLNLMSVK